MSYLRNFRRIQHLVVSQPFVKIRQHFFLPFTADLTIFRIGQNQTKTNVRSLFSTLDMKLENDQQQLSQVPIRSQVESCSLHFAKYTATDRTPTQWVTVLVLTGFEHAQNSRADTMRLSRDLKPRHLVGIVLRMIYSMAHVDGPGSWQRSNGRKLTSAKEYWDSSKQELDLFSSLDQRIKTVPQVLLFESHFYLWRNPKNHLLT